MAEMTGIVSFMMKYNTAFVISTLLLERLPYREMAANDNWLLSRDFPCVKVSDLSRSSTNAKAYRWRPTMHFIASPCSWCELFARPTGHTGFMPPQWPSQWQEVMKCNLQNANKEFSSTPVSWAPCSPCPGSSTPWPRTASSSSISPRWTHAPKPHCWPPSCRASWPVRPFDFGLIGVHFHLLMFILVAADVVLSF